MFALKFIERTSTTGILIWELYGIIHHKLICKWRMQWCWSSIRGQKDHRWPKKNIKISRLQQEIYVALFEQIFSTKIRSRMTITKEDLLEDRKITTVIKLSNMKFIQNGTIDSKCELRSVLKFYSRNWLNTKKNCIRKSAKSLQWNRKWNEK